MTRPLDRLLRREPTPPPRFAVRRFGTSAAEAAAADQAAADAGDGSANLTTGDVRVRDVDDEILNRGDRR
jgi:hypothetical protein